MTEALREQQYKSFELDKLLSDHIFMENFQKVMFNYCPIKCFNADELNQEDLLLYNVPPLLATAKSIKMAEEQQSEMFLCFDNMLKTFCNIYEIDKDYRFVFDNTMPLGNGESSYMGYLALGTLPETDFAKASIKIKSGGFEAFDILRAFVHELRHIYQYDQLCYLDNEFGKQIATALKNYSTPLQSKEDYDENLAEIDAYDFSLAVLDKANEVISRPYFNKYREVRNNMLALKRNNCLTPTLENAYEDEISENINAITLCTDFSRGIQAEKNEKLGNNWAL